MADLSYLSCPDPACVKYKSITDMLREKAFETPEKEMCIQRSVDGERRSLTYVELLNRSTYIAKYLISKGIRLGDSVAIIGPNSIEWIIGAFAIFSTGAVAVHIHKTSESFVETVKVLKSTKSKFVLLDPETDEKYISDMEAYIHTRDSSQDKPTILLLHKSARTSLLSLDDVILTTDQAAVPLPRLQPESSALIFTTSGSTGVPKMVEMTHLSIANASYIAFLGAAGGRPQGPCYNDRPFSWIVGSPVFSFLSGTKRVFVDTKIGMKKENVLAIWDIIIAEQCTSAFLLPYALIDILANISSIRKQGYKLYAISTGGQLIGKHLTNVIGQCTEKLFVCYGTTEVGGVCFTELTPEMEEGDIGSLFPGYEVKVIGDRSETVDRGHLGEILVRSLSILKSYRDAPELNDAFLVDGGWFKTGDVGFITKEGKLYIKGKANDVIKRGGLKVLSSVVETAISQLSGIREVVVISVPDTRLYEEVCACYILKDDADTIEVDLEKKCRVVLGDNVLGSAPSYWIRFESFPRLANGKTDKVLLKRLVLERLNLAESR